MKKNLIVLLAATVLLAGCSSMKRDGNTDRPLDEKEMAKALATAKPPQQFGFSVYPTSKNSIAMQGTVRLHPRHTASVRFASNGAPVVNIRGRAARMKANALVDTASANSWFEFSTAQKFKSTFLGYENRMIEYQGTANIGGVKAYASVIPQIRIKQLFMENAPVYVRMARNSLGPLSRGIRDGRIDSLIGYDMLQTFEYIQIDLEGGRIFFSASLPYTPNEDLLIGTAQILSTPGVGLTVEGAVNGTKSPVILDFAGSYAFATSDETLQAAPTVELGEVVFVKPSTIRATTLDGLPRAGIAMLNKYIVTICPRMGVVYFERPSL